MHSFCSALQFREQSTPWKCMQKFKWMTRVSKTVVNPPTDNPRSGTFHRTDHIYIYKAVQNNLKNIILLKPFTFLLLSMTSLALTDFMGSTELRDLLHLTLFSPQLSSSTIIYCVGSEAMAIQVQWPAHQTTARTHSRGPECASYSYPLGVFVGL